MVTAAAFATILLGVVAYGFLVAGTFVPQDDAPYPMTFEDIHAQLDRMKPTRRRYFQDNGVWMKVETFRTPDGDCLVRTKGA